MAQGVLDRKLRELVEQYEHVQAQLSTPEVAADMDALRRLGRELARLEPVVSSYRRLEALRAELAGAREMRDAEHDDEIRAMAREEVDRLEAAEAAELEALTVHLLPRDPNDDRNVIVEIRAGAGGDEAALFAGDLLRMYLRYADRHRLRAEVMSLHETGIGGVKEAVVEIFGEGAFSRLKFESGTHRVQRVPATESSGRIHTSTATVVVLPEAEEADLSIDEERDLRIEVKRASGPGGQGVNTTDSAVQILHKPTRLIVRCADQRSQQKNKARALTVLRSRLLERKVEEENKKYADQRKEQVGTGERNERIRTYNFPQNRLTDHRIGLTLYNLPFVMEGAIDPVIEPLMAHDLEEKLAALKG